MKMLKWMAALWAIVMMAACGGGGGSSGTSPFGGGSSGGGTTAPTMSIGISSTIVTSAEPASVAAKILDGSGNPMQGQVVSFTTTGGLGSFSAATALTDATGIASVKLSPAASSAAGADAVVATATVGSSSLTASVGFQSAGGAVPATSSAATIDVLTSANQVGSGGDTATISAVVKNAGNVGLASEPVSFTSDSGSLVSAAATTDASGQATATLSAGANKANRTIVVTVSAGSVKGQVSVDIDGTTMAYSGVTTVALGAAVPISIKLTDSKGAAVSGAVVSAVSQLGNKLSAATATTNAQGVGSLTYTATKAGRDVLTFTGAGASVEPTLVVSSEDFKFTSPGANATVVVGVSQSFSVQYLSGGKPQPGKTVSFAATAGTVTPATAVTDAMGKAVASIVSTTASPATLQATVDSAQATLPIQFVATQPSTLVLQVSPSAIGPNSNSSTAQQAQLIATVRDANGNPVKETTVNFNRIADPSGGNLSQASATTDSNGRATVQYIAGGLTTASNGVQIRATAAANTAATGTAMLTVNQSALFIALGTGNVIENLDPQTYKKDWSVAVTDANGAVVPNVQVSLKVLPQQYMKGRLTFDKTWDYGQVSTCQNEDVNYDGVLNAGEDFNSNGKLDPGNVVSVSPATVTTDSNGRAIFSLLYAESFALWVNVTLQAQAVVSGTESTSKSTFTIKGSTDDFNNETNPPAGVVSPFGVGACRQSF